MSFENKIKRMYNRDVKEKYCDEYELKRWFSNKDAKIDYIMTLKAIENSLRDLEFDNCLELGPGPGTWTKIILNKNKNAKIFLLDISNEMLKQAKKNIGQNKNIEYEEINFLDYKPERNFDLFFSSRAIEYITDKKKACELIKKSLNRNGKGIIITKKPHPLKLKIRKLLGGKIANEHLLRISPSDFKRLLEEKGFGNIKISPVIMPPKPPVFSLIPIRMLIFNFFHRKRLNFFTSLLSESYLIKFENDN